MKRLLFSVAVLLALTVAAQATARDTAARKPVLAATASGLTYHVFRADPLSLRPVAGGRSWASAGFMAASRSPDGTWLAAVRNGGTGVSFIRLATMRSAGTVQVGFSYGGAHPVAWLSKRLLVASTYPRSGTFVGIDAETRSVLWRRSLDEAVVLAEASTPDRVVLVLGMPTRTGPARLVTIRANGAVRSIELDRLLLAGPFPAEELRTPGLGVDPVANRAYVVDTDASFADVDLNAMTVAYRGGSRTLAKTPADHARQAVWVGNATLAVTGSDADTSEVNGVTWGVTTPAGLYLVDAETGSARLLQRDAAAVKVVGRSLLAFGVGFGAGVPHVTGSGLTVYGLDGTMRAHFFGTTPVRDVQAQGGLAYVSLPDRSGHIVVIDPAAGRVLRSITRPSLQVLAG